MKDYNRMPLVSIIIPTYNRAHLIRETLDSVLNQTYKNWECLVIDDGSLDNTEEELKKYSQKDNRFKYHIRPYNKLKGGNAARNYGFVMSKGEFIHWFDSDDIMDVYNLERKVQYLLSHERCDYCICKVATFEVENGKRQVYVKKEDLKISKNLYEDYILGKIPILNVTPLWRRKILRFEELYDDKIFQLQDLEFYSRLIFKNKNAGVINETLIYVRRNNSSITTQNNLLKINLNSFLEVKRRIIKRTPHNTKIIEYTLNSVLWAMRWNMAVREYKDAGKCLNFCLSNLRMLTIGKKLNLIKVSFFFLIFKNLGKGDTKFKTFLKL